MTSEKISAAVVACGLLLSSSVCFAQDRRGPSTAEERQQALGYIHSWQADPLGPQAKEQQAWVIKWFVDVPDLTVHLCSILDKLPKGDKKDSTTVFTGMFMAQAAFVIENPDKKDQRHAEYRSVSKARCVSTKPYARPNPKIASRISTVSSRVATQERSRNSSRNAPMQHAKSEARIVLARCARSKISVRASNFV